MVFICCDMLMYGFNLGYFWVLYVSGQLLFLLGFGGDIGGVEVLWCDFGVGIYCGDVGKFIIFGIRLQFVL